MTQIEALRPLGIPKKPVPIPVEKEKQTVTSVETGKHRLEGEVKSLAALGKSQIRFGGAPNDPLQKLLKDFQKTYINDFGQRIRLGDILHYLYLRRNDGDGLTHKRYGSPYGEILAQELGFTDNMYRNGLIRDLLLLQIMNPGSRSDQPHRGMSFSMLGQNVAKAWEENRNQELDHEINQNQLMDALNKTYVNGRNEKLTIGDILVIMYKNTDECDGKVIGHYQTAYADLIDSPLGFNRKPGLRQDILTYLDKLNVFDHLMPPHEYWDNVRLNPLGRRLAERYAEAKKLALNAPVDAKDKLQYVSPPRDFSKMNLDVAINEISNLDTSGAAAEKIQEIADLTKAGAGQAEAGMARIWLKRALKLPWGIESKDNTDLEKAKDILDERFFGMDPLKERILEEISARIDQWGNQGGIIILDGAPGTGKTAVSQAIAAALGRKFVSSSLSGVTDPRRVTGFERTYVGSKPGIIMSGTQQAGTVNPVFMLDEAEKAGNDPQHGSVLDTLLPVLDPQQNHNFEDNYFEFPFDLSKTLFILTANDISRIPSPLYSRAERIRFDAYLPEEKVEIAKRHLIPKAHKKFNIPPEKLKVEPKAIETVINRFTQEGGVRKLEERINSLFRKAGLHLRRHPEISQLVITPNMVEQWLPHPIHRTVVNSSEERLGEVNGMFYSEAGGGLLPVQVVPMPGDGQLTLTGSLKDDMKEAARVGLSYIRAHADKLGVTKANIKALKENKLDLHIHYPATSTPKGGPSAGSATLLALWSALSDTPIPAGVALTGEFDLRGRITAIGGVLEKVSGAALQGVKTVFLPEENRKDMNDLTRRSEVFKKIVESLDIRYVKTADELIQAIRDMQPSPQT